MKRVQVLIRVVRSSTMAASFGLVGVVVAFFASGSFTSHAQSLTAVVTDVSLSARSDGSFQAVVRGTNFPKGGVAVEINGVAAAKTRGKGRLDDGTPTRLLVRDGRLDGINASGSQAVFQVLDTDSGLRSNLFLINANAPPGISSIQNSAGAPGSTVSSVILGLNLIGASVSVSGDGVTPAPGPTNDPTRLPVTFTISAGAALGPRTLSVVTAGGAAQSDAARFLVASPGSPLVSDITPAAGPRGGTTDAAITGLRLSGAASVSFGGAGVTAVILAGGSDTNLPIRITISADAALGPRTVSVTTSLGVSAANTVFTVQDGQPASPQLQLTVFAQLSGGPDLYHMAEAPDGSYIVTQFSSSTLVRLSATGSLLEVQAGSFIFPAAVAFFSLDVGYTACNPAPLASRGFCLSGASDCPRGENVSPGNVNGVSVPRYVLGTGPGLASSTFFVCNGGTGEIRRVDPVSKAMTTIATGFTIASVSPDTRGPEQLAYNLSSRTIFVPDSGKGTLVAVDESSGNQTVLRSGLNYPFGLVLLPNGNLLVANRGDGTLVEVSQSGQLMASFDTRMGAGALRGLCVNTRGDVFLLVDKTQTIFQVSFK